MTIPTKFDDSVGRHKAPTTSPQKAGVPVSIGKSIATRPAPQIPNTDKRQMDMANPNRDSGGNTPLKVASCGGEPEATHYDDIQEHTGTKYKYPKEFQSTVDKSDMIPQWNNISGFDRQDHPSSHGTGNDYSDLIPAIGFHKQPDTIHHSMDDMKTIRSAHMQEVKDGQYNIKVAPNNQIDKKFIPTETSVYGSRPGGSSSGTAAVS